MSDLLFLTLKNKYSNGIFKFVFTLLIFIISCIVSVTICVGVGSFITVFVAGGVALNVVKWFEMQYKTLNNKDEDVI